ncbi:rCG26083 [Rattus norvegicus]|uniref:RCG26083 n=1 Tax=Rattus norvegicus TaxID=10116 RepID=A6I339_RAT|nr:rCG26083 [Rattus norvegicus]
MAAAQVSISWSRKSKGFTRRAHPSETRTISQVFLLLGGQGLVASQLVGSNRCSNHERARLLRKPPHSRSNSKCTESSPHTNSSFLGISHVPLKKPHIPHPQHLTLADIDPDLLTVILTYPPPTRPNNPSC